MRQLFHSYRLEYRQILQRAGDWLMLTEKHDHQPIHEPAEHHHRHSHPDEHTLHVNPENTPLVNGSQSPEHYHEPFEHDHTLASDLHHRYDHPAEPKDK